MYQVYQVMPGDTLEAIASRYQTTSNHIISINGLVAPFNLVPGTYLVVPKLENDMFISYIIKKGDDLYSIAKRFNTSVQLLELINGLEKGEYIYPNQELLIPSNDVVVYLTKNETLENIASQLGIPTTELVSSNSGLYVVPEQLITYKLPKNE